jgi:hypothetical protein
MKPVPVILAAVALAFSFGLADLENDKWTIQPVVYQPLPGTAGPATEPQVAPGTAISHYSSCTYGGATHNPNTGEIIIGDGFISDQVIQRIYANSNWIYNPSGNTYRMISYRNFTRESAWDFLPGYSTYPTPPDAHTYGCLTYCGRDNHLYLMHGAHQHTQLTMMWKCNYETGLWTKLNPINLPPGGYEMHALYVPWVDRIIHIDNSGYAWHYTFSNNTWVRKSASPNGRFYGGCIKMDTKRKKLIGWGGRGNASNILEWYDPVTDVWEVVTPATSVRPPPVSRGPICYYAKYDRYIVFGGSSIGDNTWMFNPETRIWKHLAMKPTFKLVGTDFDDACVNMDYSEKYDVAVYADRRGGISSGTGILMMRLSPETAGHTVSTEERALRPAGNPVISVSPNPFNAAVAITVNGNAVETLHFQGKRHENEKCNVSTVSIFDIHGRMVHRANNLISGTYTWSPAGLPAGVYVIKADMEGRTLSCRIVYQR